MEKEIVFKGEWFLPNNIDNKIKGILTFKPNDRYSILEIFGSFYEYQDVYDFDLILGNTFDGNEITLYRCYVKNLRSVPRSAEYDFRKNNSNLQPSSIYQLEYIFEGAHITNVEDLSFQKVSVEIFNLAEWVGVHGFGNYNHDFRHKEGLKIDCTYYEPNPIDFKISDKLNGTFNFFSSTSSISRFQKECKITQTTYLTLTSIEYLDFFTCLDYINKFQNFLVISLFNHINPTTIELSSDKFFDEHRIGDNEFEQIPKQINLYYSHIKKNIERPKTNFEMLFTYEDIKLQFPVLISKWFEKYELLKPTFSLLFYQFYLNEHYINVLFLNLAQATESFHYLLNIDNNKTLPSEEFDRRKKIIKESILDKEICGWVSNQLYNGLSLDARLRALFLNYSIPAIILDYIGDLDLFIKQLKSSRNYYTHYNPKEKDKALHGSDLVELYKKMQLLLISVILLEVGFEERLLNNFFTYKASRVFHI